MKIRGILLFFCCLLVLACFPYAETLGPTSKMYFTLWDNVGLGILQGSNVIKTWAPSAYREIAISVTDKIHTTGHLTGTSGAEYTLSGTFTGTTYSISNVLGHHDGATDGQYNYAISWTTGSLYRYNMNWQNPEYLFNVGSDALTITYDPTNDSFWITTWGTGKVKNYSRAGGLLSSFSTRATHNAGLALDYADGTLWMSEHATSTLVQYTKAGVFLGEKTYSSLTGGVWGAEFAYGVPEPSTVLLFALFLGILGRKFLKKI